LVIFVKAPRSGTVKSRLAQSIGPRAACAAYRRLVETLVERLGHLPAAELRFSPDDAAPEVRAWLRGGWLCRPQCGGNLGDRLQSAFAESFAEGAQRVVIIGSDCPAVTAEDIHAAWTSLLTHDVVIGPASDGGYWLIGLCQARADLFSDIPWSTDQVLAQTLQRVNEAELSVRTLRELDDVDTEADWRRFVESQNRDG